MNEYIDHTNLQPNATKEDILRLCGEAAHFNFRGVCVLPHYVSLASSRPHDFEISTVIGFPLGCTATHVKVVEAHQAINNGATELDLVWNQAAFANHKYLDVLRDIKAVVDLGLLVKVIVEECYLSEEGRQVAHNIVSDSGAFCIKTSTGMGKGNATIKTVKMWRNLGGPKIKASGGIKDYDTTKAFVDAGADIIGTSSGVAIMEKQ
jgi:deoxyribose-phosphate aldolase